MLHCPTCGGEYSAELTRCPKDDTLLQADPTVASNTPVDHLLGRTLDEKYLLEERLGIGGVGPGYPGTVFVIDRAGARKGFNRPPGKNEARKKQLHPAT